MAEDISKKVKKIIVNHLGVSGDKIQDIQNLLRI